MKVPLLFVAENAPTAREMAEVADCLQAGQLTTKLCDDVGNVRIDDPLDLVLKSQLLSFKACNLQLIRRLCRKRLDSLVEPTVLSLECLKARRMIIIHRGTGLRLSEDMENRQRHRRSARQVRQAVKWTETS